MIKNRLLDALPFHAGNFTRIISSFLYVRDMKRVNGGPAEIDATTQGVAAVELYNPMALGVDFDGFLDNALPLSKGKYEKQCECVLFPKDADREEWVLFIETKYTRSIESARDPKNKYPEIMLNQIKKTVSYFRDKNIISPSKIVYAIISFPTVGEELDSWTFPVRHEDGSSESVEDILATDKIHIRATNYATLKNDRLILLGMRG